MAVEPISGRVVGIWTRDFLQAEVAGRPHVVRTIFAAMGSDSKAVIVSNILRTGSTRDLLVSFIRLMLSVLRGRPLPLQCFLFSSSAERRRILREVDASRPAVVYIDTVRLVETAEAIRRAFPDIRLVVDMDDLMSRRHAEWQRLALPISLGYLKKSLPGMLVHLLESRWVGRLLNGYEKYTLRRIEKRVAEIADVVTFVSSDDAKVYRNMVAGGSGHATITAIPLAMHLRVPAPPPRQQPIRFVFIGGDFLHQNRLTIDYLVDLWRRLQPAAEMHFYGKHKQERPAVPGVIYHGFVKDVAEVYTLNSVMLVPSFIGGGLKTKVLEAFSHGCPVVGTELTFEGIAMGAYPLRFASLFAFEDMVRAPSAWLAHFDNAARHGYAFVATELREENILARWRAVLMGTDKLCPSTYWQNASSSAAVGI